MLTDSGLELVIVEYIYKFRHNFCKLCRQTENMLENLSRNKPIFCFMFAYSQAGRFGVLQGAERFDHTRGYRFSTYVQFWIRKSMSKMVALNARGIKIPVPLFLVWETFFFKYNYKIYSVLSLIHVLFLCSISL